MTMRVNVFIAGDAHVRQVFGIPPFTLTIMVGSSLAFKVEHSSYEYMTL